MRGGYVVSFPQCPYGIAFPYGNGVKTVQITRYAVQVILWRLNRQITQRSGIRDFTFFSIHKIKVILHILIMRIFVIP